jgi:hypothetical protein
MIARDGRIAAERRERGVERAGSTFQFAIGL